MMTFTPTLITFDMDEYVDGIIMYGDHKPEERNLGNAKIEVYHGIFKKPNLTLTMQPLKKPCN